MRRTLTAAIIATSLSWGVLALAQTAAPVVATCKDGTNHAGQSRTGACRGHGGVQAFTSSAAPAATAAPAPAAPGSVSPQITPPRMPTAQAPGAHAGEVWVNTKSKVYHCPSTRYFGTTKVGSYMTEASAKAEGDRPDHGKTCFQ